MTRKIDFLIGDYYHIYNRGVDKREVFLSIEDLIYFLDDLIILNKEGSVLSRSNPEKRKEEREKARQSEPLVLIVAYALLPNHFHLILKEIREGGISKFMHKLGTSYTMAFNEKYDRTGVLFQGRYKAKEIKYENLLPMSAYVNLNYVHHGYDTKQDLVRTSYFEFVDPDSVKEPICNKEEIERIIKIAGGVENYKKEAKKWSDVFVESHKKEKGFEL